MSFEKVPNILQDSSFYDAVVYYNKSVENSRLFTRFL